MKRKIIPLIVCSSLVFSQPCISSFVDTAYAATSKDVLSVHNKIEHLYNSIKSNSFTSKNVPIWKTYISDAKKLNSYLPVGHSQEKYNLRIYYAETLIQILETVSYVESELSKNENPSIKDLQYKLSYSKAMLHNIDTNLFTKQQSDLQSRIIQCENKLVPNNLVCEKLSFGIKGFEVQGELIKPKTPPKNMKTVIIVGGSGPSNKDGSIGNQSPYKDLAYMLGDKGIASFRYDKRTLSHIDKMTPSYVLNLGLKEEYLEDYNEIIHYLQRRSDIVNSEIYTIGHSQGGNIIPMLHSTNPSAKGYIFLAANYFPLEDHILRQNKYLLDITPGLTEEFKKEQISFIQGEVSKIKTLTQSSINEKILGIPAKYWLEYKGYDPAIEASKINKPMLFIQGLNDYQVTIDDLNKFKDTLKNDSKIEFKEFEGLTHTLSKGDKTPNAYLENSNVDPSVINSIVEFLNK
ncbi:MAG: alpha/beta hydrolase [Clostridium sp.]